ncbi:hypothetical protein [Clostridium sp. DJ247]|nr:hypothetical protein [Clostridium sp. DJ247]MBC2581991.1 hypothetical protein [Clostridium sp. DJ247]
MKYTLNRKTQKPFLHSKNSIIIFNNNYLVISAKRNESAEDKKKRIDIR